MEIRLKQLLAALKPISLIIDDKNLVEQSEIIFFDKNAIKAFNGEMQIITQCEMEISGGISAKEFINFANKLDREKVIFSLEKNVLKIHSGRTRANFAIEKIKLHEIKLPDNKFWKKVPTNFCKGLEIAKLSLPSSDIVPELAQVYVEENFLLSCDTLRATRFYMSGAFSENFVLSKNVCNILCQNDITDYFFEKGWIHFKDFSGAIFSCLASDSRYPSKKVFALFKDEGTKINLPKNFTKTVERIASILDGNAQDKLICLSFAKGGLICKGESGSVKAKEKRTLEYSEKDFSAFVNPSFLISALKEAKSISVSESFLLIKNENYQHIISLQKTEK